MGREALRVGKAELVLKPVVVASVVAAGSVLAAGLAGPHAFLITAGSAALGITLTDVAKQVADLFSSGLSFSRKQKEGGQACYGLYVSFIPSVNVASRLTCLSTLAA
jgi:hypothetical protein